MEAFSRHGCLHGRTVQAATSADRAFKTGASRSKGSHRRRRGFAFPSRGPPRHGVQVPSQSKSPLIHDIASLLTIATIVAAVVGCCTPCHGAGVLPASIWKPPVDPSIRHESARGAPRRTHVLLRATSCSGTEGGWTWLRRQVHLRDVQDLSAVLSPNHLEHEGKYLSGR